MPAFFPKLSRPQKALLLLAALLFLSFAIGVSLTRRPWCDEAWFASAGFNLAAHGKLATSIITPAVDDPKTIGLSQRTYWVMPLHLLLQAAVYKAFGFNLFTLRSISVIWGLGSLVSWFVIVRVLTRSSEMAALTAVLLGTDYVFILRSADGRMDMMASSLAYAGLAAYLVLRNRSLPLAILVSHSLVVLSGLTHPNGGLLGLADLIFISLLCDRRAIKSRHVAIAFIPYVAGSLGWSLYIAQDPGLFLIQFGSNASHRLSGFLAPLDALRREVAQRYLAAFGHQPGTSAFGNLKILPLIGYLVGLGGTLASPELRKRTGVRALLAITGIHLVYLTLLDSVKHPAYLVYAMPVFCAVLAVRVGRLWTDRRFPSTLVAAAVGFMILLQLALVGNLIRRNLYRNSYLVAAEFLKKHAGPPARIVGEPEFGFDLGFDGLLQDDRRLGFYSHELADFVVIGEDYPKTFAIFQKERPEIGRYVKETLSSKYRPVFQNDLYTIFARR
ncbi:MAG: glycosyltransferase family 39 protein [Bryobacteraceae bacterium]